MLPIERQQVVEEHALALGHRQGVGPMAGGGGNAGDKVGVSRTRKS